MESCSWAAATGSSCRTRPVIASFRWVPKPRYAMMWIGSSRSKRAASRRLTASKPRSAGAAIERTARFQRGRSGSRRSSSLMGLQPPVLLYRDRPADALGALQVDLGEGDPRAVRGTGNGEAPGVHDQGVPIARLETGVIVLAVLGGRHQVALALDGAGAEQRLPVVLAGHQGEGRRDHQDLRSLLDHPAVELAEPHVVADRQPDPPQGRIGDHHLLARHAGGRLGEAHAAGHVHVEEVHLAVGGGDPPLGREEDARVEATPPLLALFVVRSKQEPDPVTPREIGEAGAGGSVQRLGAADLLLMGAEIVGVLRRGDELRAIPGGALDQRAGALPIGGLVRGTVELDDGGEEHVVCRAPNSEPRSEGARLVTSAREVWIETSISDRLVTRPPRESHPRSPS